MRGQSRRRTLPVAPQGTAGEHNSLITDNEARRERRRRWRRPRTCRSEKESAVGL